MSRPRGSLRRVLAEPGTPYGRLAGAGLLGLASAAATIGLLAGSGYLVGRAALRPGLDAIVGLLAAVEVLAFLRGPLRYAERLVGHDAALRSLTGWRVWLYDRLSPRVPAALSGWRSGDLLARAIDDVDALQDLYLRTLLPVAIAVGAAVIGTVAVGLILPWAALALGVSLAVALALPVLLTWRRSGDDEIAELAGSLSAQVVDALEGAPELMAFGADDAALERIEALGARADTLERHHARIAAASALVIQVCLAVAVTTVLALGVAAVHDHRIGQVMVAVLPLAALATFETVPGVPLAVGRALSVRAAADRLFALDAVPVPVRDPVDAERIGAGVPEVRFDDAALRYGPGLPRALDGVSLRLASGGRVAVTGSSGAGKSSLVNALLRYWPLESGSLSLSGTDVTRLTQADVRGAMALADQRAQLFAGTVRSNITLGRPGATDEEVEAALRAARLAEWVATLPEGLDTPVGEDGVSVSGGERRRLAVARALLAPAPLLILDEPTSGLDTALAEQVVDGVLAAAGERSVLLITHRAGEAARCEETLTLEAGRVSSPAPAPD
ncbi:MAG TPA: thiol reductant ABC exporter subunit CydC [Acidimicrobiales bacterium]|nr:thiol reductant ABC exporter subunit CydC [Acidimicrobiales bacterium]